MRAAEYRARHMTEGDLQTAVCGLLTACGWHWFHDTDSRRNRAGLPDIVAVHPRGLFIAVELKGPRTPVSDKQQQWADALERFEARTHPAACFTGIIRPHDWDTGPLQRFIREAPSVTLTAP